MVGCRSRTVQAGRGKPATPLSLRSFCRLISQDQALPKSHRGSCPGNCQLGRCWRAGGRRASTCLRGIPHGAELSQIALTHSINTLFGGAGGFSYVRRTCFYYHRRESCLAVCGRWRSSRPRRCAGVRVQSHGLASPPQARGCRPECHAFHVVAACTVVACMTVCRSRTL
jgi:hypothetical protein